MGWLWGEKEERTKIEYKQEAREHVMMNNRVLVTFEMVIRTPVTRNLVYTMKNTKVDFELPADTEVRSLHLKKCEVIDIGG